MTPKQARLSVHIFTALVIASVAVALANLTWRLFGYTGAEPVLLPGAGAASQTDNLGPILALAPFGVAASALGAVEGASGATLKAVFAASTQAESVALIAGADGTVVEYRVGDATPIGVVEQIETERVVLRTGSGQRILGFDADGGGTTSSGAASARSASVGTVPVRSVPASSSQPSSSPAPSGVDAIRALIPQSQQADPPPPPPPPSPPPAPTSAAPPIGYNVGGSPSAAMRAAGIRSGDIIQRVNGKPITGSSDAVSVLAITRGAGSARVEVLRQGKTVSLSIPTR